MVTKKCLIRNDLDGEYNDITLREKLLPWQKPGLSYTGYGKRIPTCWVADFNGRTYRVYCTIYSNVGSCWIISKGVKYYIS